MKYANYSNEQLICMLCRCYIHETKKSTATAEMIAKELEKRGFVNKDDLMKEYSK